MSAPVDDRVWRSRYILMSALQIGGIAIVLIGLLIGRTTVILAQPEAYVGAGIAVAGLLLTLVGPRMLRRHWKKLDAA